MPDLGQVLGAFLTGLAHARRLADEETALIAGYYQSHPLLKELSLPRVRVPEVVIDLPVIIDEGDPGTPGVLEDPHTIISSLGTQYLEVAKAEGLRLPNASRKRFEKQLRQTFREEGVLGGPPDVSFSLAHVTRAAEVAISRAIRSEPPGRFDSAKTRAVSKNLVEYARVFATKEASAPPTVQVLVRTSDVKELADPASITRIRITLQEEGLEWTTTTEEDGSVRRFLTPE